MPRARESSPPVFVGSPGKRKDKCRKLTKKRKRTAAVDSADGAILSAVGELVRTSPPHSPTASLPSPAIPPPCTTPPATPSSSGSSSNGSNGKANGKADGAVATTATREKGKAKQKREKLADEDKEDHEEQVRERKRKRVILSTAIVLQNVPVELRHGEVYESPYYHLLYCLLHEHGYTFFADDILRREALREKELREEQEDEEEDGDKDVVIIGNPKQKKENSRVVDAGTTRPEYRGTARTHLMGLISSTITRLHEQYPEFTGAKGVQRLVAVASLMLQLWRSARAAPSDTKLANDVCVLAGDEDEKDRDKEKTDVSEGSTLTCETVLAALRSSADVNADGQKRIVDLEAQLAALREQSKEKEEKAKVAYDKVAKELAYEKSKAKTTDCVRDNDKLTKQTAALIKERDTLKQQNGKLASDLKELQVQHAALKDLYANEEKERSFVTGEIDKATEDFTAREQAYKVREQELTDRLETLQQQHKDAAAQLASLLEEFTALEEEHSKCKTDSGTASAEKQVDTVGDIVDDTPLNNTPSLEEEPVPILAAPEKPVAVDEQRTLLAVKVEKEDYDVVDARVSAAKSANSITSDRKIIVELNDTLEDLLQEMVSMVDVLHGKVASAAQDLANEENLKGKALLDRVNKEYAFPTDSKEWNGCSLLYTDVIALACAHVNLRGKRTDLPRASTVNLDAIRFTRRIAERTGGKWKDLTKLLFDNMPVGEYVWVQMLYDGTAELNCFPCSKAAPTYPTIQEMYS